jgi:(heptosyl)LPS beta-1,4-glucosyltransferase
MKPAPQPHLTAIIISYNEAEHIRACIDSLQFADHVLVFDAFSDDGTPDLARQADAAVLQRPFDDFAAQRNAALDAVADQTDFVLFVDADERVTPELAGEIRAVLQQTGIRQIAGWRIPRHNYIFGRLTRGAGWYPDYQTRLLRVGAAQYDPAKRVHEVVQLEGELGTLQHHLTHYNYSHVQQFRAKQRRYVRYDAESLQQQGVRPKPYTYITQPLRHFWWRFVTLRGYRDGWHGLRLSALMAWYEFRKYWVLRGLLRP